MNFKIFLLYLNKLTKHGGRCTIRTIIHFAGIALLFSTTATAQTPIPRQGDYCPTGTYKSGDYCKPLKSTEDQVIIQKSGKNCPTGFYKAGNYCKRMASSDREALPREDGAKCPTGWYKSGSYCVKQ